MRTFTFMGPNLASLDANMNGSITMDNGQAIPVWYFGNGSSGFNNDRQAPSPVIEAIEGELVQVTLASFMPHSIHFHGLDVDQANDGVPNTSGYISQMTNPSFGRVSGYSNLGTPFTYQFIAPHAGTYMYHCHIDTVLHFEQGMYGTVIVRPPDGSTSVAWAGGPAFDREYIWHLHTFDSSWHNESISGAATVRHRPDYFMLNGRDGSVSLNDPTCAINTDSGDRILIRTTNVGYQPAEVDLGGMSFTVIASDGRPLPAPLVVTELLVAPGERYDILATIPANYNQLATISYWDIRLKTILGTVQTTVVGAATDSIFSSSFEDGE